MTKEKKKTKKTEKVEEPIKRNPITFEIEKSNFNKLIKAHLNYISKFDYNNVLSGILCKVENKILTMVSIDGNRLLKTEMPFDAENFEDLIINGLFLAKIKIIKGIAISKSYVDLLEITLSDEGMKIVDMANNITYQVPVIEGQYPKYEQLIKKPEDAQTFTFNVAFLEDLKNILVNERTNHIHVSFDKENNLIPIIVEAENGEGLKSTSLIMPVQVAPPRQ